jgi:hypothetical protein
MPCGGPISFQAKAKPNSVAWKGPGIDFMYSWDELSSTAIGVDGKAEVVIADFHHDRMKANPAEYPLDWPGAEHVVVQDLKMFSHRGMKSP